MSRFSPLDLIIELSELCRDIASEVRHQLNYYRASVYKSETSRPIVHRVEKLRLLANLMNDEILVEAFRDHDAEKALGVAAYVPGECSFSTRTTRLLQVIEKHCEVLIDQAHNRQLNHVSKSLARDIQKHRRELLQICKHGSRQWAFFQAF